MDKKHRYKRKSKHYSNKKTVEFILIGAVCILMAVFGVVILFQHNKKLEAQETQTVSATQEMSNNDESSYQKIEFNGQTFTYNTSIINILFLGVDSTVDYESYEGKTNNTGENGRADSIHLVTLDRRTKKMSIIAIPRDTMTDIEVTSATGKVVGWANDHLALAYSYGDGKDKSCRLVKDAVSKLFNDIPIVYYCAANLSSLDTLLSLVDSVELTVPNSDLERFGDEYLKGNNIVIDSSNIERFVRYRDTQQVYSNNGRMERQKVFLSAFFNKFREMSQDNLPISKTMNVLNQLVSNIGVNELTDILDLFNKCSYNSQTDYYIPKGEQMQGVSHDEYYVDTEDLQQMILNLFYEQNSLS